ncbi:C-C chemokine receptor type 1 [Hippoglossus stenolepis]|uniref:C-C chemokine receptor type 1 n=1 Tax=Hippoglossus stenolepis TaxID=195615 RepID=UPI00159C4F03|nr:C-C chemokine receptor type 1 [Hippoglossus stenolepis]XP_047196878.1 C-C chemokine receptor type 1 [Hippoglossus stenolepis]
MSDTGIPHIGTTATQTYEYYYNENNTPNSCDDVDLKEFGSVFLPTLYSLVFIVGFLGNGLVVCVVVKHRNSTTLTDICLFNLALSDLVFLLTLPFYAHYSKVSHWPFGDFMCRFISTCHHAGFFSSVFFMVAMTLDRYVVIMHTHRVAGYRTLRAGVVLSTSIWLLSLCVSLPAFIFTNVTNQFNNSICDDDKENSTWEVYNIFATNILGLVIPLLVMVVCYSRIIPTLVNMKSARRHRAVKLIISLVAVFFLLWVPFNICNFLLFLQSTGILPDECNFDTNLKLSVIVTETFAYTHCCLNPIIYAFVGQKFMKRALQLLGKWVPGIRSCSSRDLSDRTFRKSSVTSRSSDVTHTIVI